MKKLITVLICLSLAFTVFAEGQTDSGSATGPVVLKFGVNGNTSSVEYATAVKFNETLESVSGGTVKCEIFPNGQLGDAKEMINQIAMNELDLYMEPVGGLGSIIPELAVLEMPYVVKDLDHISRILDSRWGMKMQVKLKNEYNIRILNQTLFGTHQTSSNKPLYSIDDYKGLRLRTPNSRALKDWAEAIGARPTTIAFSEVYLALKTNSVDGQENPLPTIEAMKFFEAQKAVAIDNHLVQDKSILFSDQTWNSMSEEQQGWMKEASEAAKAESIRLHEENSDAILEKFKKAGLEITLSRLCSHESGHDRKI